MPIKDIPAYFVDGLVNNKRAKSKKLDGLNNLIDWKPFDACLRRNLKSSFVGNPSYPPIMMFKALIIQRLYDLSDPALEDAISDSLSFSRFIGLSLSQSVPDETTICRFRNQLIKQKLLEKLFDIFTKQLESSGLNIKKGIIVDASIIESSCRPRKKVDLEAIAEDREEDNRSTYTCEAIEPEYSKDTEAKFLKKGNKYHYGYKVHTAVDVEHGFVLASHTTSANFSDTKGLAKLLPKLPAGDYRVFTDKGYTSAENTQLLKGNGYKNGIMQKKIKGQEQNKWSKLRNKLISKVRYKVEQSFGIIKRIFGLHRSRYIGRGKVENEFFLVSLAFNMNKLYRLCCL